MDTQAVILAAGRGTRMKSEHPKVLHEVLGRPMIDYSIRAALGAGADRAVVIVGYGRDRVRDWIETQPYGDDVEFAVQEEQRGTGHAVWCAEDYLDDGPDTTLILSGDVPLMEAETLRDFAQSAEASGAPMAVMTAVLDDPAAYGRVVRDDEGGRVQKIVEYADATERQRQIDEINAGFYAADTSFLADMLPDMCRGEPDTAQGEYYLTDLVELAARRGGATGWQVGDPRLIQGVNTRADLAEAIDIARSRINRRWMEEGVTFIDPESTHVGPDVELARDVVLHPAVQLQGETEIGEGTVVENGSVIRDSRLDSEVYVKAHCYVNRSKVGSGTQLGPFAHLRPGADIGRDCKVGNYVEVKKSTLEDGVKAGHLTYLGDAHLGEKTNVGAGTITCNYDGETKHRTEIGREAFIGSNASLVAPVEVEDGAYIGAGSTVTDDVPSEALAVGRGRQRNVEDWASDADDSDDET